MQKGKDTSGDAPESLEGAHPTGTSVGRSATGGDPGAADEVKRWSARRKNEVVLRLLRGEPVDAISREVSVPIYKLERWRDRALAGIDAGLKELSQTPTDVVDPLLLASTTQDQRPHFVQISCTRTHWPCRAED